MKHIWTASKIVAFGFLFFLLSFPASAEKSREFLSFQGYTGLLNTPDTGITPEGTLQISYSNHREPDRLEFPRSDNYIFSVGFFSFLEIGARLTADHPVVPHGRRDLSANLKMRIPMGFEHPLFPEIAFGLQDMGGGASFFQTRYGVLSKEIGRLSLSLGYGTGPDRMEGLFGGGIIRVFDWAKFIGEYDSDTTRVGIRLSLPQSPELPMDFAVTARTALDSEEDGIDLSFCLAVSLGKDNEKTPGKIPHPLTDPPEDTTDLSSIPSVHADPPFSDLDLVKNALADHGLENIQVVSLTEETLFITYENNRYMHNELEALGIVMGLTAIHASEKWTGYDFVLKNFDIPVLLFRIPARTCKAYFRDRISTAAFSKDLEILPAPLSMPESKKEDKKNPSSFKPVLRLYPGLMTYVGTEYGVFDYLVSLKSDLRMGIWPGGFLNVLGDIPLFWSEDFSSGGRFANRKEDAHMENFLFHQAVRITPTLFSLFSIGKYQTDYQGIMNETVWMPGMGNHRFTLKSAAFKDDRERKNICIGAYRYLLEPLDLYLEGKYGQFWNGDHGMLVKTSRWFGDTALSIFYRHVGTDTGERAGGIAISIPLTPAREMKPLYAQITGAPSWSYEHQTTIAESGEKNPIDTGIAIVPNTAYSLETAFLDRDRLNGSNLRSRLYLLRDAFKKWCEPR